MTATIILVQFNPLHHIYTNTSLFVSAMLLHVLPELILQGAAGTEQAVPLVDEEEREDHSLGQEEGLFAAYCKEAEESCWDHSSTTAKSLP